MFLLNRFTTLKGPFFPISKTLYKEDISFRFITTRARDTLCEKLGIAKEKVLVTIPEVREYRAATRQESIGFVPTMGALHAGHLSLIKQSKADNELTMGSIFVNAGQFAPHEDFGTYPRTLEKDIIDMFQGGCDVIFAPSQKVIYPHSLEGQTGDQVQSIFVTPMGYDERVGQEGNIRPGFFRGVATVVCKLFNIVQPTRAYFGQKDGLQCIVVRQLVHDLNIPTEIVLGSTIREPDGLAMSSRNRYLSVEQRKVAPKLYESLQVGKKVFIEGVRSYEDIVDEVRRVLSDSHETNLFAIEYISLCDALTAEELKPPIILGEGKPMMLSAAINFGDCRILDNVLIGSTGKDAANSS